MVPMMATNIGDQDAHAPYVERLQINEGRAAECARDTGMTVPVAHDVIADFSFWRFNRVIDLARRRPSGLFPLSP